MRLALLDADLAARVQQVGDPARLRRLAEVVARMAIDVAGTTDDRVRAALDSLAAGEPDQSLRADVRGVVELLDMMAWDLQEAGEEVLYTAAFARARAADAVVAALDPDPLTAVLEAAYEAHAALGDRGPEVLSALARALDAG